MVIKKLLFLLLLLPALVEAQTQRTAKLYYNYDVASTSYIYCRYVGGNGSPSGAELQGGGLIETSGSSTTISESVTDANPFAELAVGDLLIIRLPTGTVYNRRIVTYTSDSAVVVDAAVDLGAAGVTFTWLRQQCGTAATDGWIEVALFERLSFQRVLTTLNATSIETQVECRISGIGTTIIDTSTVTATGTYHYPLATGVWDACRMGVKVSTDTGVQSITGGIAYLSAQ